MSYRPFVRKLITDFTVLLSDKHHILTFCSVIVLNKLFCQSESLNHPTSQVIKKNALKNLEKCFSYQEQRVVVNNSK